MSETTTRKPNAIQVLREARRLIAKRGWVPTNPGSVWNLPDGPLCIREAVYAAARYPGDDGKTLVAMNTLGPAIRALCAVARLGPDASFVELGRWQKVEGRTQAEVLALFDRTADRWVEVIRDWLLEVEALENAEVEPAP